MNTYEKTNSLISSENKSEMFDTIYLNSTSEITTTLFSFIKDSSLTFCKDISTKCYDSFIQGYEIRISEKQTWCLVFELLKIKGMFNEWMNKEIELTVN